MSKELELTIEEIQTCHADQWVLVEETAWDTGGIPIRGMVVACGSDREKLVSSTRQLHTQKPGIKTFVFYAGPKVPEDISVVL